MGKYKKTVITNNGLELMARSIAGEVAMTFSHAKTSNYVYPTGTNLTELTVLEGIKQSVIPSNVKVASDTLISVRTLFSNETVSEEYLIQNIGLYATDGETEILFSVSQAEKPDLMPVFDGDSPSSFIYNIQPVVSQAMSLSLSVNPAGTATVQDVIELENPAFDDSGTVSGITDKTSLSNSLVSNMPMAQFMRNVKAGFQLVLYKERSLEASLPVSGWSSSAPYTQTISVPGVTENDIPTPGIIYPSGCTREQQKAINKAAGYIYDIETGAGTVTVRCTVKPATAITLGLKGVV